MLKQAISHTILVSFLFFHAGTFFGGNEMKEQKTDNDVGIFDILPLDMIKEVFSNLPRLVDKKNFYLCSTNCTNGCPLLCFAGRGLAERFEATRVMVWPRLSRVSRRTFRGGEARRARRRDGPARALHRRACVPAGVWPVARQPVAPV